MIRSAIPHSKPDIERARSELRRLRYVDGSPVNPSEHACAVAIDTAGGAAELAALMPRVLEHLENYPDGRPKKPRAFVRWIGPVLLSHLKQNSAAEPGKKSHGRRGESATLEKLKKSWERSQNAKPVPVS